MASHELSARCKTREKTRKMATGEEPMTGPQRSYLQSLCREAGEEFDPILTNAEESKKIEELQAKTGHGNKWIPPKPPPVGSSALRKTDD
jgi:hypothetical protein